VGPWPEYAAGLAFAVVLLVGLRRRPRTEAPTRIPTAVPAQKEPPRMTAR
jgi:MYXO-CTERM domain-containing protein